MKNIGKTAVARILFAALAALGVLAGPAAAQMKHAANFTLPFTVEWKGKTLPAGDYQLRLDLGSRLAVVQEIHGKGSLVVMPAGIDDAREITGHDSLLIECGRSGNRVTALRLESMGYVLSYERKPSRRAKEEARVVEITLRAGD